MRIAIVNDKALAVEALRRVVTDADLHQVAWVARDGAQAVEQARLDPPDLILMDLVLPVLDGVEATRRIMKQSPCPILIVTATMAGNISRVYEAMGHGALDAVVTPVLGVNGTVDGSLPLAAKIANAEKVLRVRDRRPAEASTAAVSLGDLPRMVAIGSSTGGPSVLAVILAALPENLDAAVVLVQHVDAEFAPGLADWLSQQAKRTVELAAVGDVLRPGRIVLAASTDHLVVRPDQRLDYRREPAEAYYRPSIDEFFFSAARHWPAGGVACLLTGMGRDGADGLKEARRRGWYTVAQNEESSVVYDMPKAAAAIDAAVEILPPAEIAYAIECGLAARRPRD
ncbi:MAG: chemotaxis-specific protein-glutamate methyltransferase CheB [Planctomycetia bacterium]